jgi:tRNA-(ms[2]io[6]A)-hydroxylase
VTGVVAEDLPGLATRTSPAWALRVLVDPIALLDDHAHLEKKAAGNALDLLARWPQGSLDPEWTRTLSAVARDEAEHLLRVVSLLGRRGGRLSRHHRNTFAAGLRRLVRSGQGPEELTDRLLVSALIEARSAERFSVLAGVAEDRELARLYAGLERSERGHHLRFLALALSLPGARSVPRRWHELLLEESRILAVQPPGPGLHSGEA